MPKMSDHEEFLNASMLENGDIVVLLDEGEFRDPEETGLSRTVFQIRVGLPDQRTKVWTMNKTTRKRLAEAYGDDSANWVKEHVKIEITKQTVRGEMRNVLYGYPVEAPKTAKNTDMIIKMIREAKPQLTEVDIEALIGDEITKAAGLLTEEAAVYLVARSLDVKLTA